MIDAFYECVAGLFGEPDSAATWAKRTTQKLANGGYSTDPVSYDYFAEVFGGLIHDDAVADLLADDFIEAAAENQPAVAVCHSNACRIILHMLTRHRNIRIDVLHLFAAADNPDCDVNGLNEAVARGQIGKIIFYVSPIDEVLGLPVVGYGVLGKVGPRKMSPAMATITAIIEEPFKHSEWVENLDRLLAWIVSETATAAV